MDFRTKRVLVNGKNWISKAVSKALIALGASVISEIGKQDKKIDTLINHAAGHPEILKKVVPFMLRQGYGRIINVAEPLNNCSYDGYIAARNEISAFTRTLGRELAAKNIYVNAVIPGLVKNKDLDYNKVIQSCRGELMLYLPVQRPAEIEEIVEVILFLASDEASYICGQAIRTDGFAV